MNNKKIYGTRKLIKGDILTVTFPLDHSPTEPTNTEQQDAYINRLRVFADSMLNPIQNPPAHILYNDNEVAVVFKPSGVHTLSWAGTVQKNVFAFNDCLPIILSPFDPTPPSSSFSSDPTDTVITSAVSPSLSLARPSPCHRLDARVSGCVVVAKTKNALADLSHQFENRLVKKEYRAVVAGDPLARLQCNDLVTISNGKCI